MTQVTQNGFAHQGVSLTYNTRTNQGYGITTTPSGFGQQVITKLGISSGDVLVQEGSETTCLDRDVYVNLGERYGLYDRNGRKVTVKSRIDIKKTVNGPGRGDILIRGSLGIHGSR